MLKPPFTAIILKETNPPMTLRVTTGFIGVIIVAIAMLGFLAGVGISGLFGGFTSRGSDTIITDSPDTAIPATIGSDAAQSSPDILSVTINEKSSGGIALSVQFTGLGAENPVYVWVIVNPGGDTIVHPRNPLFKGLPVDFQNGVHFLAGQSRTCTIDMTAETKGLHIETFRVVTYSEAGDILIDRIFKKG